MIASLLPALLLGLGLAAASGLRTFLPLLLAAGAARLGLFGVELNGALAWLQSDAALAALAFAATAEFLGDKVPVVDHALDALGTVVRPLAGALAAASVFAGVDPVVAGVAGLIVGAPTALAVHGAKAGTRVAGNAATVGVAAPVLSFAEDALAVLMTALALMAPLLVPVLLLALSLLLWRGLKRLFGRRRAPSPAHPPASA
jgi:hypothetical protein